MTNPDPAARPAVPAGPPASVPPAPGAVPPSLPAPLTPPGPAQATPGAPAKGRSRARGIGLGLAAGLLIFVTVVFVLFVVFNTQTVEISLVFGNVEAPLVVALLIAAGLGVLLVTLLGLVRRARRPKS